MIRLKSIVEFTDNTESNNIDTIPEVLFLGDSYTKSRFSYARKLSDNGIVNGKVVAWPNINIKQLTKLLSRYITDKTSIVSILFGDIIKQNIDLESFNKYLTDLQRITSTVGANLVIIRNPSNLYNGYEEYLTAIDEMDASLFININGQIANSDVQTKIANNWISYVNRTFNMKLDAVKVDDSPADAESDDVDSEDEITSSVKNKVSRKNKPGNVRSFINTFKDIAIEHQKKYGIPASITLAQGALESGWGASYLASSGNNYFGIKCHSWTGEKIYADDDAKGECFRKYDSPEESFNDHALFLKQNSRYKSLFKTKDYLEWAYGLQAAGYATSQKYATSLINLIETFGLDEYDDRPAGNATVDDKLSAEKIKLTNLAGRKLNVYSPYGMRKRGMHRGIDYSPMPVGSKIYIVMPGTVREAGNIDPDGWGNTIMVDHEDGTTTLYAHLSSIDVKKGDTVKANMFIGKTGGALGTPGRGNSEGAHLHWEYHPGGYTGKTSAVDGELVAGKYFKIV